MILQNGHLLVHLLFREWEVLNQRLYVKETIDARVGYTSDKVHAPLLQPTFPPLPPCTTKSAS